MVAEKFEETVELGFDGFEAGVEVAEDGFGVVGGRLRVGFRGLGLAKDEEAVVGFQRVVG